MHRRACLAMIVGLAATPALAQPVDDPQSIVTKIYAISAGRDGKYSGDSAFLKPDVQRRWYSKSLRAALAAVKREEAKTGDVILDFDPVTNSQDPSVKRLAIAVESQTDAAAVVSATFFSFAEKEPSIVRYVFIREGADWKLDDMRGEHAGKDKWVLRGLLKF